MGEAIFKFLSYIIAKLLSVRLIVTLLLTITVCWSFLKCFDLILEALQATDEKLLAFVKEIFLFIGGGLISAFSSAITLYFTRTDRNKNDEEETK